MIYNFKHFKTLSITELKSDIDEMESLTADQLPQLLTAAQKTAELYYKMVKDGNSELSISQEVDIKTQIITTYNTASQLYNDAVAKNMASRRSGLEFNTRS